MHITRENLYILELIYFPEEDLEEEWTIFFINFILFYFENQYSYS